MPTKNGPYGSDDMGKDPIKKGTPDPSQNKPKPLGWIIDKAWSDGGNTELPKPKR